MPVYISNPILKVQSQVQQMETKNTVYSTVGNSVHTRTQVCIPTYCLREMAVDLKLFLSCMPPTICLVRPKFLVSSGVVSCNIRVQVL